ncbi:outer membrane beta-barrel protein [Ramlibacter sp. USB13]|uniref:Outer membrane beta-barrel protein n=1 Tax=Ramlibacter cellulosilyticus TaxID=2764187 RepID=A0A923MUC9_9BURK|nr:outer membrane beta-barrel protein [Ramlibacter cellulosilyticus]MBC5785161.1 outer membrane beta-barrel protein [Ramlibacter cellulosilyticus]
MASKEYSSIAFRVGAIGLAVLGATLSTQAAAQWAPGWYIGGNVGRASTDFDQPAPIVAPGVGFGEDDKDTAWKLYGGYQINRNFAIEGGYYDLGRYDFGYAAPGGTGSARYQGLNLDLVGSLPLSDRFSVFGRIGAAYTRARTDFGGTSRSEREWGPKYGLGVEYAFTPQLAVRGEWERYRVDDAFRGRGDIDVASIGLVYRFGAPAVTRVVAPAPAPAVIPAPAPAPRVIAPVPAPAPQVAPAPAPAPVPAPAPAARPYRN